jgi:hypothetical protein
MALNHSPKIVTDGLVLCLDAANQKSYGGSGTVWKDLSKNGNDATLVNGVGYDSSNNGSLIFDGVDDTVDCGPMPEIGSSLTGLTASVWIKTQTNSIRCILENGTSFTTNTFYMFQENDSNITFLVYGEGGFDLVQLSEPIPYNTNIWFNVVGVWQSGQRCKIYYNGVDKTSFRGGSTRNNVINGNTNMFVGARAGTQFPFLGDISNVQIYNRALSPTEIQQNFGSLRGRYGI